MIYLPFDVLLGLQCVEQSAGEERWGKVEVDAMHSAVLIQSRHLV